MGWRRAAWCVAVPVALLVAAGVTVSVVNRQYCAPLLGSAAAAALFDATAADRASVEGMESDPPVLVWLEPSPAGLLWLEDEQRCDGKSQLRVLYRDGAHRASIEQRIDTSRLRDLGPARLDQG